MRILQQIVNKIFHAHRRAQSVVACRIASHNLPAALVAACLFGIYPYAGLFADGGILTDGKTGTHGSMELSGGTVDIDTSYGTPASTSIFYSFSNFNINTKQTVNFTDNQGFQNAIARVTGNSTSNINGLLHSDIPNFFLINSNGVTFGPKAQIEVPSAFHVSTADKIDFVNGSFFTHPNLPENNIKDLVGNPVSLGFLATNSANNGLLAVNGAQLQLTNHQKLDFVGKTIEVDGGATIQSESGEIRMAAIKGEGSVSVKPTDSYLMLPTSSPSTTNSDNITIGYLSLIDTSGNGGGRISIYGDKVTFKDGAAAQADNTGGTDAAQAKGVVIVSNTMLLDGGDQFYPTGIHSNVNATGKSGDITIHANTLDIKNNALIDSTSFGSGNSGNIQVTVNKLLTIDSGGGIGDLTGISSEASGSGKSGNIQVNAESLNIINGGVIASDVVKAKDTDPMPSGNAGSIKVEVANTFTIDSKGNVRHGTGIDSSALKNTAGNAGNLEVTAGNIEILNGGFIRSSTAGSGNAGTINVTAKDILKIDGEGIKSTGILSETPVLLATGDAGVIIVKALNMDIRNNGGISSASKSLGRAGVVDIETNRLSLQNKGYVSSESLGPDSAGNTGNISILAHEWLHLTSDSEISIRNEAHVSDPSTIHPGNISINATDILMQDSNISSASTNNVAAGNIIVNFSHWLTMDPSKITTEANFGNGGAIIIKGGELINLQNSGLLTSVEGPTSNGGDISVTANLLVMETGVIQANARGGTGGNIQLNLGGLIPSNDTLILGGSTVDWQPFISGLNVIQAASKTGVSGVLNVTVPQLNLSGVLGNLGGAQFDTSIINQDYCGLTSGSSLTSTGRGGLLPNSNDLLIY